MLTSLMTKKISISILLGMGFVLFASLYIQAIYFNFPIYYDSGVFAYVGSVINSGKLPYVDVFDHKGLFIYIFNSLGLRAFDGDIRGVYVFELCVIATSFLFSLVFIRKILSGMSIDASMAFVALVASYAILFEGGNLPETLTFPWQLTFYSYAAYILTSNSKENYKVVLLVFFALIALFVGLFTRPNNALGVLFLSWILSIRVGGRFFYTFTTFSLLIGCFVAYLIQSAGLHYDLYNQYIQYNFYYSKLNLSLIRRLMNSCAFILLILLSPSGFFLVLKMWNNRKAIKIQPRPQINSQQILSISILIKIKQNISALTNCIKNIKTLNIFCLIFFVDLLSQLISGRFGRGYLHYGVIVLPSLFITTILCLNAHSIYSQLFQLKRNIPLKGISLILFVGIASAINFNYFAFNSFYKNNDIVKKLSVDIENNSTSNEKIYVSWADAWIYVLSHRGSFSRYFYPNPIWHTDFDGKDRVSEILAEYTKSPPKLLVIWKEPVFEKAFDIEKLRERLLLDYHIKIKSSEYTIYVRND